MCTIHISYNSQPQQNTIKIWDLESKLNAASLSQHETIE